MQVQVPRVEMLYGSEQGKSHRLRDLARPDPSPSGLLAVKASALVAGNSFRRSGCRQRPRKTCLLLFKTL